MSVSVEYRVEWIPAWRVGQGDETIGQHPFRSIEVAERWVWQMASVYGIADWTLKSRERRTLPDGSVLIRPWRVDGARRARS